MVFGAVANKTNFGTIGAVSDWVNMGDKGRLLAWFLAIGQGVTGMSTLALGSLLTFVSIVFGSALTMKVEYYRLDEQGFFGALYSALADMKLLPAGGKKAAAS